MATNQDVNDVDDPNWEPLARKRFKTGSVQAMDKLVKDRNSEKTQAATRGAVKLFQSFITDQELELDLEKPDLVKLDDALRTFYFCVRKKDGKFF